MTDVQLELDNVDELVNSLERVTGDGPGVQRVLKRGGQSLAGSIRKRTPVGRTRSMRRAVAATVKRSRSGLVAVAGYNVDKRHYAPHAGLVVGGTKHRRNKRGANRGRVKPNDIVARSVRQGTPKAITAMADQIQEEIER